jgi:hypothetical protein
MKDKYIKISNKIIRIQDQINFYNQNYDKDNPEIIIENIKKILDE